MGTYIRTCAEIKTAAGWEPLPEGQFPPVPWHGMDEYEKPAYSEPFRYQSYAMFALFAGVRNDSQCQVLAEPRGLPEDISESALQHLVPELSQANGWHEWGKAETPQPESIAERICSADADCYGYSWLGASELLEFDYAQEFTNQRCEPPLTVSYREFLGALYFQHLEVLKAQSADHEIRILFCFQG